MTRRTRRKEPSSSRGFARAARGAWGTRGTRRNSGNLGILVIENRNIFSPLFQPAITTEKNNNNNNNNFDPMGAGRGARRSQTGGPNGPDGARRGSQRGQMECSTGARRGGGQNDYLLLKEKTICSVYVSCKSSSTPNISDAGWM
jgi:hypothetical protein